MVGDFVAAVCLYVGGVRGSGWGVVIGVPMGVRYGSGCVVVGLCDGNNAWW